MWLCRKFWRCGPTGFMWRNCSKIVTIFPLGLRPSRASSAAHCARRPARTKREGGSRHDGRNFLSRRSGGKEILLTGPLDATRTSVAPQIEREILRLVFGQPSCGPQMTVSASGVPPCLAAS
jgi:hypothetical protein